jgi:hypothetical protein
MSCRRLSCSPLSDINTAVQELFEIGIQRYLIGLAQIDWYSCAKYVVLAASSAFACVIALISTGIAQ